MAWVPGTVSRSAPSGSQKSQKQRLDLLRRQRQGREHERKRVTAAELLQRTVRGHLARARVQSQLDGECAQAAAQLAAPGGLAEAALALLCSSFGMLAPSRRAPHAAKVVAAVAAAPDGLLRQAAEGPPRRCGAARPVPSGPDAVYHRCRAVAAAAAGAGAAAADRAAALGAATDERVVGSARQAQLLRGLLKEDIFAGLREIGPAGFPLCSRLLLSPAPEKDAMEVDAPDSPFVPDALDDFVVHLLGDPAWAAWARGQRREQGEGALLAALFGPLPSSVRPQSALRQLAAAAPREPEAAGRALLVLDQGMRAAEVDSSFAQELLQALQAFVAPVHPRWLDQHARELYLLQPACTVSLVAAARAAGQAALRCAYALYATMLAKGGEGGVGKALGSARVAVLTAIAFAPGLLQQLWREITARLALHSPTTPVVLGDTEAPLVLFALAAGQFLDCAAEEEVYSAEALPPTRDLALFCVNHSVRMLWATGPPSEAAQRSVIALLLKLRDWDCRRPVAEPKDWLVPPPGGGSWPQRIDLNDWRARVTGSPVLRTYEVLQRIPFVIPFDARVLLFRGFIDQELDALRGDHGWGGVVRVRRDRLFEDGMRAVMRMTPDELRGDARVGFIDSETGEEEAGLGHGVFKEFLLELVKVAFDPGYGLFMLTPEQKAYPNPNSGAEQLFGSDHLRRFHFIGRVIGMALHEGVLADVPLARFVRNLLLDRSNSLHDLSALDAELHRNLLRIKTYSAEELQQLCLTFSYTVESFGTSSTVEFFPGGAQEEVTPENRMRYIHMMAHYKLNYQIADQAKAMRDGLQEVISPELLRMFDANELQVLLSGHDSGQGLDIDDWERHTTYGQGYHANHHTVRMFWEVVREMKPEMQRRLLKFVTSVDRAPLLGFAHLYPPFCINQGGGVDRLPSSGTCFCLLKLPPYGNKGQLRDKLSEAILHDTGFGLS
eukprot:TRINITY_DN21995_c0_g1_i3.p1 TRINITY_DN21995_c0_g1~~TRINITY_DN21995_c0_g1_i3.p1  ORF type:complete len:980 (+),score=345.59 TRINITY_DN21995_c0_g1_i3:89-2941(+)